MIMNSHPDRPPFTFSFSLLLLVKANLSLGAVKDYGSTRTM